ncbi:integrase core domain-containing protein [Sphingobium sp. WW5]|uniref:integrase core domain-containing protein n=1 Tax=Sphingobium sp. WW5 TaxID=3111448 RepID=UPI003C20525C
MPCHHHLRYRTKAVNHFRPSGATSFSRCPVYLHAYASVSEARSSIGQYLGFYNARRPHSSLGGRTPDQTYFDNLPQAVAA